MAAKEIAKVIFVTLGCVALAYQAFQKFLDAGSAEGTGSIILEAAFGVFFAGAAGYLAVHLWRSFRGQRTRGSD